MNNNVKQFFKHVYDIGVVSFRTYFLFFEINWKKLHFAIFLYTSSYPSYQPPIWCIVNKDCLPCFRLSVLFGSSFLNFTEVGKECRILFKSQTSFLYSWLFFQKVIAYNFILSVLCFLLATLKFQSFILMPDKLKFFERRREILIEFHSSTHECLVSPNLLLKKLTYFPPNYSFQHLFKVGS